jgi:diguanylate cyclase (GGDEF)-like protein
VQFGLYLTTTVSIGIASLPEDAQEVVTLIGKADGALYEAKKTGKNKWCVA